MAKVKKSEKAEVAGDSLVVAAKREQLTRKLYELAGDESKADEFEAVRVELESLVGA